jgi:hypothetical protein
MIIEPLTIDEAIALLKGHRDKRGGDTPTNITDITIKSVEHPVTLSWTTKMIITTTYQEVGK